ncbi:MAG: spore photoproduct lyase [Syntrophomonas sp.]|uniref:SPL family radical SAM protein n=1 Tax=Syntrophomonas sp. TaxID=2053627 RepID=UPI002632285C|nr:spore photoproduct lyase [Syntrophomonas sp.]MDD4627608.1 spore photoproduct lyase [Syntrophomonas sp.]
MFPEKIFYEPPVLHYELGKQLQEKFAHIPWIAIENHNNIEELRKNPNKEFVHMKRYLILGVRKSLKYTPNHKVSDFLVPYTSSGCSAMCLYCYLVCNYNKCSYLRLFVNREQMLDKLMKTANRSPGDLTFEIGSNSDLLLENSISGNLEWTIENFAGSKKGFITFPTKFDMVEALLPLNHGGRTIMRMSVNPQPIIQRLEFGTSSLTGRIRALQQMHAAGYKVGILIAPVVLLDNWQELYSQLIEQLADELPDKIKKELFIEIIFMTYSYIHRAINAEAFPNAVKLYDKSLMTGRGRGKYCYRSDIRLQAEEYLKELLEQKLNGIPVIYIV